MRTKGCKDINPTRLMKNTIIASALVALVATGGAYAFIDRHASAQTASPSPAVVTSPEKTPEAPDTDNIQDEKGGPEKVDAVVGQDGDKETNDDNGQKLDQKSGVQETDAPENSQDVPDAQ